MKTVAISIDDSLFRAIDRMARNEYRSVHEWRAPRAKRSELIRRALEEYVRRHKRHERERRERGFSRSIVLA